MLGPLIALVMLASPPAAPDPRPRCMLTVGDAHRMSRGEVKLAGYHAVAATPVEVTLAHGKMSVSAVTRVRGPLTSLTLRPPGVRDAGTLTCTQKAPGSRPPRTGTPIPVVCAVDGGGDVTGQNKARFEHGGMTWRFVAQGYEMRLQVEGKAVGFAAVWADTDGVRGGMLSLHVNGRTVTCSRP